MMGYRGRLIRWCVAACLMFTSWLFLPSTAKAEKLWVLIATDDEAVGIGAAMKTSSDSIKAACKANASAPLLEIRKVPPRSFGRASIEREINNLKVGPDDAVLFFYVGHGAFDSLGRGTFLLPTKDHPRAKPLFVSDIDRIIRINKRPRFQAVVVDCCNEVRKASGPPPCVSDPSPTEDIISPLFRKLFFGNRGSLIMVSSSEREYAVVKPDLVSNSTISNTTERYGQGTLFTENFKKVLSNRDVTKNWDQVSREIQAEIDTEFPGYLRNGFLILGDGRLYHQANQNIRVVANGAVMAVR